MSNETIVDTMSISIAEIQAHPAEAMAALIETVRLQGEEITHLQENFCIAMSLIAKLRDKTESRLQPAQRDQREVLKALLVMNNYKMFAKDARLRMRMSEAAFSRLLAKMKDDIEVKPFSANRRKNLLCLRSAKG
jgi:hypothetical protein